MASKYLAFNLIRYHWGRQWPVDPQLLSMSEIGKYRHWRTYTAGQESRRVSTLHSSSWRWRQWCVEPPAVWEKVINLTVPGVGYTLEVHIAISPTHAASHWTHCRPVMQYVTIRHTNTSQTCQRNQSDQATVSWYADMISGLTNVRHVSQEKYNSVQPLVNENNSRKTTGHAPGAQVQF